LAHRALPSFPTRRSSDLDAPLFVGARVVAGGDDDVVQTPVGEDDLFERAPHGCAIGDVGAQADHLTRAGDASPGHTDAHPHLLLDRKSTRLNSSHVSISY